MARCAVLIAIMVFCIAAPASAKEIEGYSSDDLTWTLGEPTDKSFHWGFRSLDFGWDGWEILYDPLRIIEPVEMQNWELPDRVTVKSEILLVYYEGTLELLLFDVADDDLSYRRIARILNDYYNDTDNTLAVDKWSHRVWIDANGKVAIVNRYIDVNGDVRTRMAYMTASMGAQLAGEEKPEWFTQLTDWMERKR